MPRPPERPAGSYDSGPTWNDGSGSYNPYHGYSEFTVSRDNTVTRTVQDAPADNGQPGRDIANARDDVKKAARGMSAVRDVTQNLRQPNKKPEKLAAKPRAEHLEDKRPHCKPRPNRGKSKGGGSKGFVPWC